MPSPIPERHRRADVELRACRSIRDEVVDEVVELEAVDRVRSDVESFATPIVFRFAVVGIFAAKRLSNCVASSTYVERRPRSSTNTGGIFVRSVFAFAKSGW